ncbi:uncharacterized protein [Dysidea avara]|uniref:uncharacterized protein n=1 Tax=Dysidea avara TaxID=196820 RepID=UPI003330F943
MQPQVLLLLFLAAVVSSATYSTKKNPCLLDSEVGPCKGLFRRYFFNKKTGQCEKFFYGGCGGNANNFKSKRSCEKKCRNSCPIKGQVFQQCRTCPATCTKPDLICILLCKPGCGCPPGQLIDTINKKCVKPSQCPIDCSAVSCLLPDCARGVGTAVPPGQCCPVCVCKVGGKTLFPGDTFKKDCNTCTCSKNGLVACTEIACAPVCPPTCSPTFCNNPRNKYKPCSRPPPFTVPPCPNACRTTFCDACYYSDTALPTPSQCANVCRFPPTLTCLRNWASCVKRYSNIYRRNSSTFRCYEYNCPTKG